MKKGTDTKIVIIGMGFLMEYIMPCYKKLLGDNFATNVVAVTADDKDLKRKQESFGFKVVLNENKETLENVEPDIILFAPPPSFAPEITESVLKPYYEKLRKEGKPLPDLYAFPPNPAGKYYLDTIGYDINVANILPNMVSKIGDMDVSQEGYTNVTFPKEKEWPEENRARIFDFFTPIGYVVEVGPDHVIPMLGGNVCVHNISEVIFTIYDSLKKAGKDVDYKDIASAMRYYHQEKQNHKPDGCYPCSKDGVDEKLYEILKKVTFHWYEGIKKYYLEIGMSEKLSDEIIIPLLDLHIHSHQVETRETIEYNTKCHATKGGVLEMGCRTFYARVEDILKKAFENYDTFSFNDDWCNEIENGAYIITQTVSDHGYNLSKKAPEFEIEHHATMFGLMAKYADKLFGEEGLQAIDKAVAQYGRERGGRMAQRAKADGAPLNMMSYLLYGEWRAKDGEMNSCIAEKSPVYKTECHRCQWCESWKKHDLGKYGPNYCNSVDYNLVKGFNEDNDLIITQTLSNGSDHCSFEWVGFDMDDENEKLFNQKAIELGNKNVKDFKYHTAHIYFSLSKTLSTILGEEKAKEISEKAFNEFCEIFSKEHGAAIMELKETDFNIA